MSHPRNTSRSKAAQSPSTVSVVSILVSHFSPGGSAGGGDGGGDGGGAGGGDGGGDGDGDGDVAEDNDGGR